MSTRAANRVTVVEPGADPRPLGPGVGVDFKIHGDHTGGALSIVEHPFEVGALVPPHIHTVEDEISIVLDGEMGFRSNEQEVVLGPGGYIVKPRGEVHAMWNAGRVPARIIEIITPAGFEGYFEELSDAVASGEFDMGTVVGLAQRYQLPFAEPDWLPDVIARYGLTPPPAM